MSKFEPGDFLKEEFMDYHLFVEEINKSQYHVWHCWCPYEQNWPTLGKQLVYSKNAGHDCWMDFDKIDKRFTKIAKLPALIGRKMLEINI